MGQPGRAVAVIIAERCADCRGRDADSCCSTNCLPPGSLALVYSVTEIWIKQQVFKAGLPVIRLFNALQESGPDYAAATPQHGDVAVMQIPVVLCCSCLQLEKSLRITADLGCKECLANLLNEFVPVCGYTEIINGALLLRTNKYLTGPNPFIFYC